ncbi:MAG TPA: DUF2169 domain-containing protein [Albitalea sp.]|nr:DUF2169 domain-containing protein [Albitalea sp.]
MRDRHGAEVWLVAVKATFDIGPDGAMAVSQQQPPVLRLPEHHGEPGRSSIKYEADLVLTKRTTDVLVVGQAHAPAGRQVESLEVGFQVAAMQKRLRVFGNRRWGLLKPTRPEPFQTMPIVYERAFGGVDALSPNPERDWDWRNPVGCGFAVKKAHLEGVPVPNIEWPDRPVASWDDRPAPAGFGAIGSHWQPRASFAGTYDEGWKTTRQPLLPDDFDDAFFQCAPPDQQAPRFMIGGEPVTLVNLSPSGRLHFALPRVHLGFETRFHDGSRQLHRQRRLHTVILEPGFPRVSLVWHTALPCHFKVHKLERTIVTLKQNLGRDDDAGVDAYREAA